MPRRLPWLPAVLVAASLALAAHAAAAQNPDRVWIAWLDGRSVDGALDGRAPVLDRFPDALVLADAAAAAAYAAAGFRVEPPVPLRPGATVTLLRARRAPAGTIELDDAAFAAHGAEIAWRGGRDAIVLSDGPLAEDEGLLVHQRKVLRTAPLPVRRAPAVPEKAPAATGFAPIVQDMVDQVSGTSLIQWIENLDGKRSVTVGVSPVSFATRSTPTAQCDLAEQYVYERFLAMGFTDVQYDPYTFSSTSARNIVATLPGVESPGKVVVLGAHLDSTSPVASTLAPGANDNASGVAGLLVTAEILRQYSFRNTIRFIAFTGEEQGLYGSQHYAAAAAARGDTIVGAVIYDMIAWKSALNQIDIEGETAWQPVMTVMNDACAKYTSLQTNQVYSSWGSDHVPFQDAGYPSFLAIESEYDAYPCYHQTCDTTGWNLPVFGGEVAKAGLATVAHLAGAHDFFITHSPLPSTENTSTPYEVVADISKLSPLVADSLLLHWAVGAGPETQVTLTATGVPDRYHAYIPAMPSGTHVFYWLSALDSQARRVASPAAAPASRYDFMVAARTTLWSEGFETGGAGWTHGGTLDDWQVATPAALGGDPASAYAGTKVAGTDLTSVGATAGKYENGCDTWFESPAIDCSAGVGIRLAFARWLNVERSNSLTWDYARVLVNGTTVWESPSAANLAETAWSQQELDIAALADGQPSVKIRFTLHSDGSVNYGGWNLDELRLTGMDTTPQVDVAADGPAARPVLHAGAPNPGGPGTVLRFELPRPGPVDLALFDVRGRRVRTLARGAQGAGPHAIAWDGRSDSGAPCAAGVYFCRLATAGASLERKIVFVR